MPDSGHESGPYTCNNLCEWVFTRVRRYAESEGEMSHDEH